MANSVPAALAVLLFAALPAASADARACVHAWGADEIAGGSVADVCAMRTPCEKEPFDPRSGLGGASRSGKAIGRGAVGPDGSRGLVGPDQLSNCHEEGAVADPGRTGGFWSAVCSAWAKSLARGMGRVIAANAKKRLETILSGLAADVAAGAMDEEPAIEQALLMIDEAPPR